MKKETKYAYLFFFFLIINIAPVALASGYNELKLSQQVNLEQNINRKGDIVKHRAQLNQKEINNKESVPNTYFSGIHQPRLTNAAKKSIFWLFIQSVIAGLLAVFTPYVYTILPFTVGYLEKNAKTKSKKLRNSLYYAMSIIIIFSLLGLLISLLIKLTGIENFTEHWIFNLFFFRIFITLGISFLGAFSFKLPDSWINSMAMKAKSDSFKGIFFMALTLPGASFSSTFPIIGLVLVLAGNVNIFGPTVGLLGFSIGLGLPFVFPVMVNIFSRYTSLLNNIKVVLGFFSLMLALKFLSKADVSLDYHLLDRNLFLIIWLGLWAIMGIYMLGAIKLSHDTATETNRYGQEYVPLLRFFIAIISLCFALYLAPGIWGAPLKAVSGFLP